MSRRGDRRTRVALAQEAARLMYEEDVGQYFAAKRVAARRLGDRGGRPLRVGDLPSNGEIQAALLAHATWVEGDARLSRLACMRQLALTAMDLLQPFEPRLIGSVATGHVHRGSDIDVQLFSDDPDAPEHFFRTRGWPYERRDVLMRRGGVTRAYQHLHLAADFPIELSVYPRRELRVLPRSSTDGKPMLRLTIDDLKTLLAEAH